LLTNYGYIGLYLIAAVLFTLFMVIIPIVLRFLKIVPSHPNPIKNATFECGMETFLALDVLVVFLYPWAVSLRALGISGFVLILILIFIVFVGYLYAWRKKVLEWK